MANKVTPKRANDAARPKAGRNDQNAGSWLSAVLAAAPLLGKNRSFWLALSVIGLAGVSVGNRPEYVIAVVTIVSLCAAFLMKMKAFDD